MKKWFCMLIIGVMLLTFTACGDAPPPAEGDSAATTTTTTTTDNALPSKPENLYAAFLNGHIGAAHDNHTVYMQELVREGYPRNGYALYDMNGDACPELLVRTGEGLTILCPADGEEGNLRVWFSGPIYVKPLNNGAIYYERPGAAPTHTDYAYITLRKDGTEAERTSFSVYEDKGQKTYFVDEQEVDAAAYQKVYDRVMPQVKDDAILWQSLANLPYVTGFAQPSVAIPSAFAPVLQNQCAVRIQEKDTYLSDYPYQVWKYAVVDMDGDGQTELVLEFKEPYILVIGQRDNTVVGYECRMQSMYRLYTDGSFLWQTDAGKTYGRDRLQYTGTGYDRIELERVEHGEGDTVTYYVEGQAVTEQTYKAATETYRQDVQWSLYSA